MDCQSYKVELPKLSTSQANFSGLISQTRRNHSVFLIPEHFRFELRSSTGNTAFDCAEGMPNAVLAGHDLKAAVFAAGRGE